MRKALETGVEEPSLPPPLKSHRVLRDRAEGNEDPFETQGKGVIPPPEASLPPPQNKHRADGSTLAETRCPPPPGEAKDPSGTLGKGMTPRGARRSKANRGQ